MTLLSLALPYVRPWFKSVILLQLCRSQCFLLAFCACSLAGMAGSVILLSVRKRNATFDLARMAVRTSLPLS